jgi:hypothetical protein
MTRMSSTIASSILRKFSACRSSLDENGIAPILVTPSTTCATSGRTAPDALDRGQRVLDDVVQQAGGDATASSFMSARKSASRPTGSRRKQVNQRLAQMSPQDLTSSRRISSSSSLPA